MSLAFIDRPPTPIEMERFRLILSTYQNGTGQLITPNGMTLPGWRDFEKSIVDAFDGQLLESNNNTIVDVYISSKENNNAYGISCRMRSEVNRSADRINKEGHVVKGRISMELSNSAKYFWAHLKSKGIDESNFREKPTEAGVALIELVKSWHDDKKVTNGRTIDLSKSFFLALVWDRKAPSYRLYQFPLDLPDPKTLHWHYSTQPARNGQEISSLRLSGDDEFGSLFEWYGHSGGQLKYYPLTQDALWASEIFYLEPLEHIVVTKNKILKREAIQELKTLMEINAKEEAFQDLLQRNPWMFGSEYSELLDNRDLVVHSTQDFVLRRVVDSYLEIIEIKRPLKDESLFKWDRSHKCYYPGSDVSVAIGQVLNYIEKIDSNRYAIQSEFKERVSGVRAKIFIGRDGDEDQQIALRRINNHLYRIEILTYDQLVRTAEQVIKHI